MIRRVGSFVGTGRKGWVQTLLYNYLVFFGAEDCDSMMKWARFAKRWEFEIWNGKQSSKHGRHSENFRMFWEAGRGEEREGKGMGAKLLFMTARNEQPHHTSLALIGLEG